MGKRDTGGTSFPPFLPRCSGQVRLISLAYRVYKKIKFELSLGARYSDRMMGVPPPSLFPQRNPKAPSPVGAFLFC